jgi:pimeloyl-ACP methyl ester carboxylesterase
MDTGSPTIVMERWPAIAPLGGLVDAGLETGKVFAYDSARDAAGTGGPAVLLIHGLGDEADSWRRVIPILARRSRAVALDLPGFGRSESLGRVGVSACVGAVLGLLDALSIGRAVFVGSSLGAVIAEIAAFRAPSRCAGLVLVDGGLPGLKASSKAWKGAIPIIGRRGYRSLRGRPEAAYRSLGPYYADLEALAAEDRAFLRARVEARVESESQERAYFQLFRSLAMWMTRSAFFARGLRSFEGPIYSIWGALDRIVDPASADAVASLAPRGRKEIIPGAGHLPQQERPERLAELILDAAAEARGLPCA